MTGRFPPGWVDAAWWEIYGAELQAERLSREAWIGKLAKAWCLIRVPESLTVTQRAEQEDWSARLLGLRFYTTEPYRSGAWSSS